MSFAQEMLKTSPSPTRYSQEDLAACIAACVDCAQTCTACADACLGEEMVAELRRCITTDLNCAELCEATGRILSRQSGHDPAVTRAALTACHDACRLCAAECDQHAEMHEHCRLCAEACRRCKQACDRLLAV